MRDTQDSRFWDDIAPKYARDTIKDMAGYERSLMRSGELIAGKDVLELGCGTGATAIRLAPEARRYLATDFAARMIAQSEERLREAPVAPLSFRQATAESLAAEGRQFDVVLGFNYLHLVRGLSGTLQAIHALVRPGGLFVSKTACLGDMSPAIRLLLPLMRAIGKAPFVQVFSSGDLEQAIAAQGFSIVALERHATKGRDTRPFIIAAKP